MRPSTIDVPLAAAIAALPLVVVVANVPGHLLLPGIAALAFVIAGIAAAGGWLMRVDGRSDGITIWDFAGACGLVGTAAAMLSDPHHVTQLLGVAIAAP